MFGFEASLTHPSYSSVLSDAQRERSTNCRESLPSRDGRVVTEQGQWNSVGHGLVPQMGVGATAITFSDDALYGRENESQTCQSPGGNMR